MKKSPGRAGNGRGFVLHWYVTAPATRVSFVCGISAAKALGVLDQLQWIILAPDQQLGLRGRTQAGQQIHGVPAVGRSGEGEPRAGDTRIGPGIEIFSNLIFCRRTRQGGND